MPMPELHTAPALSLFAAFFFLFTGTSGAVKKVWVKLAPSVLWRDQHTPYRIRLIRLNTKIQIFGYQLINNSSFLYRSLTFYKNLIKCSELNYASFLLGRGYFQSSTTHHFLGRGATSITRSVCPSRLCPFVRLISELWLAKTSVSGSGSGGPRRGCVYLYSFSFLPHG